MHPVNADDPAGRTGTRIGSDLVLEAFLKLYRNRSWNLYMETLPEPGSESGLWIFMGAPGATQVARPKEPTL